MKTASWLSVISTAGRPAPLRRQTRGYSPTVAIELKTGCSVAEELMVCMTFLLEEAGFEPVVPRRIVVMGEIGETLRMQAGLLDPER